MTTLGALEMLTVLLFPGDSATTLFAAFYRVPGHIAACFQSTRKIQRVFEWRGKREFHGIPATMFLGKKEVAEFRSGYSELVALDVRYNCNGFQGCKQQVL